MQARLKLAERQRQKLDESLIRARDANREDGAALSELEHKQALASEEIVTLRAECVTPWHFTPPLSKRGA